VSIAKARSAPYRRAAQWSDLAIADLTTPVAANARCHEISAKLLE
jgi:hypothetical protein